MQPALRLREVGQLLRRAIVMVAVNPEHRTSIGSDGFKDIQQRTVQLAVAQEYYRSAGCRAYSWSKDCQMPWGSP